MFSSLNVVLIETQLLRASINFRQSVTLDLKNFLFFSLFLPVGNQTGRKARCFIRQLIYGCRLFNECKPEVSEWFPRKQDFKNWEKTNPPARDTRWPEMTHEERANIVNYRER